MFTINNIDWYINFIQPGGALLMRSDGSSSIGVCDNNTTTIYLDENLHGPLLKKVLCHELVHASIFSYGIELSIEQEETIADIIATYGEEIIDITNQLFKKIKGR